MKSRARGACQELPPLETVQALWQNLACRFFENRLPRITIEWSTRLTSSAGLFVSRVGPRSLWVSAEYRQDTVRVIRLSAPLLRHQPEEELWRTLAHEMIHQWQFDVRKHRPSHGAEFREMMHRMNAEGLGITVRHRLVTAVQARHHYAWQCLQCGMAYYRQRRTIIPSRHMCSRCRGTLVERAIETREDREGRCQSEQRDVHDCGESSVTGERRLFLE